MPQICVLTVAVFTLALDAVFAAKMLVLLLLWVYTAKYCTLVPELWYN